MIAWWTLVAASLAAIGSIIGPLVAYRAAMRSIAAHAAELEAERRTAAVDRAVDLAVGTNPKGAEVGVSMLDYFAESGELTDDQARAVYSALDSSIEEELDPDLAGLDETDLDETDLDETDLDETDLDETDLDETADNGADEGRTR